MENSDKRIEKGKETKEIIINATVKLFSKKGYDGTSIKDITDLAGVPKSLFYHYFKTKDEILEHLIHLYTLRLTDKEKAAVQQKPVRNLFEEAASRIFMDASFDKDMLKIIVLEALKNKGIFEDMLKKMDLLFGDFYSILPEQVRTKNSQDELKVFSFYFRFIPIIYFILSKDTFSEYYGIQKEELDKHLLKLIRQNPYIDQDHV